MTNKVTRGKSGFFRRLKELRFELADIFIGAASLACLGVCVFHICQGENGYIPPAAMCGVFVALSCVSVAATRYSVGRSNRYLAFLFREAGIGEDRDGVPNARLLTAEEQARIMEHMREYASRLSQQQLLRDQAEYTALQSQIDPHFLYNTLDTIRGKAMECGQTDISDMIESLSRIFRYSISNNSDMLALQDELKNVKDYVKIQQIRFANRFSFNYLADESDWRLMYFRVPKLVLQPLMENSILHGLESMVSGGEVSLYAYRTESQVILRVEDNGPGMTSEQVKKVCASLRGELGGASEYIPKGIALSNINKRVKYIYGEQYGLTLSSTEGYGTAVEIIMPYSEADYDRA